MPVIDVDSHFEPTDDWLDEFPSLKARLPARYPTGDPRFAMRSPEMFAWFVTDDLLRGVPAEKRMPMDRLVTPHMRRLYDPGRRLAELALVLDFIDSEPLAALGGPGG